MKINGDATIIGGGPIGSSTAASLAQKGYDVTVVEQKKEIGVPLKCAGLVSKRVFDLVNIDAETVTQNKLYGAYIHSPKGKTVLIKNDKPRAFAIDRVLFDKSLAEVAKKNGAVYLMNTTLDEIEKGNGFLKTRVKHGNENTFISSKILIGADGARSKVRKMFNLPEPQEMLLGIGAEVENIDVEPQYVHVFLGKKIAPGFFAWIIPTEKNKARIGLGSTQPLPKPVKTLFNDLFNYPTTKNYLQHAVITNITAGNIPLGIINETVKDNVMIVGDAAAQVKPISGGGLYTGLLSSKHCSEVAAEELEENKPTFDTLKKYHELWTKDIKREISFGMKIRKRFIHMNDNEIEHYFTYLEDETIISIISQYGDIDYPSRLLFPIIKNSPKLLHLLPKMMHLLL